MHISLFEKDDLYLEVIMRFDGLAEIADFYTKEKTYFEKQMLLVPVINPEHRSWLFEYESSFYAIVFAFSEPYKTSFSGGALEKQAYCFHMGKGYHILSKNQIPDIWSGKQDFSMRVIGIDRVNQQMQVLAVMA